MNEDYKEEWQDMPEFVQEDLRPVRKVIVSFATHEDVEAFERLINQKLTKKTKSIWFPKMEREKPANFVYTHEDEPAVPDIHNIEGESQEQTNQ